MVTDDFYYSSRALFNQILELCCFRFYWKPKQRKKIHKSLQHTCALPAAVPLPASPALCQPSHLYPESLSLPHLGGMATTISPLFCCVIAMTTQMCCPFFHLRQLLNKKISPGLHPFICSPLHTTGILFLLAHSLNPLYPGFHLLPPPNWSCQMTSDLLKANSDAQFFAFTLLGHQLM